MTKTPVVHAQQRWEYLYFTRKSENALYTELCTVGQEGWELVAIHYYKDAKGIMTWIAFLKRPSAGPGAAQPGRAHTAEMGAGQPSAQSEATQPAGFDLSGDVFEIRKEP